MNFTLSTILIIFFLVPGFIFRRAYYSSPFPRKYSKFSLFGEISWIIIPSVILQIFGIYLVYWFWDRPFIELQNLYVFILDCYKTSPIFENNINFNVIVIYTAILWIISFVLGFLINLVIRRTHLDKRFRIFSFDNEWYYYLSGEILDFPHVEGTSKEVGLTFVDVLTKTGEETVLYSGICQKFDLKEDGGLASICLTNVQRKGFVNNKTTTVSGGDTMQTFEYKEFPSTFLVIPFENILNLNVRFFKVKIKPYKKPEPLVALENRTPTDPTLIDNDLQEYKKVDLNFSKLEAVILGLTLLILIVALISIFSKPDKVKEEKEEDISSFIFSFFALIICLISRFLFHTSWPYSILWGISAGIGGLLVKYFCTRSKKE
ncbi:MAG: hypothetical protein V4511_01105 [Bacteroidota bacterium]